MPASAFIRKQRIKFVPIILNGPWLHAESKTNHIECLSEILET